MTLPTRSNGDNIEASWFNSIKTEIESIGSFDEIVTKTADYTADLTEGKIIIDTTSSTVDITLPSVVGNDGEVILIKALNLTNLSRVLPDGAETIDGAASYSFSIVDEVIYLGAYEDGSEWVILNNVNLFHAHLADTTTHGSATALVGVDETQTLTNKSIDSDNNTITNIVNADIKAAAAIDAAKIHDGTISNTEFGYLNGVGSTVVGVDDTNTLTNKTLTSPVINTPDIDGGTATDASRIVLPKDTTTNLDALTDVEAIIAYDTTLASPVFNNGAGWTEIGSGGGAGGETNFYPGGDANEHADTSSFSTGNNATFDGGGSIAGTFSISTDANDVIDGTNVFKLVGHATAGSNDDDYIASEVINIPQGYRGRNLAIKFQYKNENADDALVWRVKDTTNGTILTDDSSTIDNYWDTTNYSAKEFTMTFYCPGSCAQIEVGPQVLTGESSTTFIWDEVVINADPFIYKDLIETQEYKITQAYAGMTDVTTQVEFNLGTATIVDSGANIITASDDSGNSRTIFTANQKCTVNISWQSKLALADSYSVIYKTTSEVARSSDTTGNNRWESVAASVDLEAGEYFTVGFDSGKLMANTGTANMSFVAIAETANVVHHSAGTENTFSASIANNGSVSITSQSSPNAPAIASVVRNGAGNVTINFTSGFFTVAPSVTANCEGIVGMAWLNGLPTTTSVDIITDQYDNANTDANFMITLVRQGTDYKNPNAFAVTPVEQVCYLKDVQANTTAGGTFTQDAWQTRTLNTTSGDDSFVTLSSNQFTIPAGRYEITASAPARECNTHKAKIYNITDSADEIIGTSEYANDTNIVYNRSIVKGEIVITVPTTFELQHYCGTTKTTNGFGVPSSNGTVEVYAQVEIRKLK